MRIFQSQTFCKKTKRSLSAGMTLIELLVVLSIFVVVTGMLLFDYGTFKSSTSLDNISNDIALSLRKAQSYAIGAYGLSSSFTYPYGVHFSTNPFPVSDPQNGSDKAFVQFTDVSNNYLYNSDGLTACSASPTATNECTEILNIASSEKITGIYLNESATPVSAGSVVDVVFIRPNPDAYFCYRASSQVSSCDTATSISHIKIRIQSLQKVAQGTGIKTITVWNTGQISVQ